VSFNQTTTCALEGAGTLKADHLFIGCDIFGSILYIVWQWLDITSVSSSMICDHYAQFTHMAGMPRFTHSFFKVIWLACTWVIWKEGNNCVLKNTASDPYTLLNKVKLNSFLWLKTNQVSIVFCYLDCGDTRFFALVFLCNFSSFCFGGALLVRHQWHCNCWVIHHF